MDFSWLEKEKQKTNNTKSSSSLDFSWMNSGVQTESTQPNLINFKPSLSERWKGTPIKQAGGTFTPTTGIKNFITGLPKATLEVPKMMVEGTIKTGQTLGESLSVNRGDFDALNKANQQRQENELKLLKTIQEDKKRGIDVTKRMEQYNKIASQPYDTIETLAPKSQISNKEAIGNLAMMATEMVMPGEAGLSAMTGKLLARKTIQSIIASKTTSEIEKMLAKKFLFNVGTGYGMDVGRKLSEGKTTKESLKPGLITLLSAIFTGAEAKTLLNAARKTTPEIITSRALGRANFGAIPEAGKPPVGYINPNLKYLPEGQKLPPKTPIKVDVDGFRPIEPGEVLPNGYTTKMNQTTGETLTNAPVGASRVTDDVAKEVPIDKVKVGENTEFLQREFPTDNKITLADQSEQATKFMQSKGLKGAIEVLESGENLPGNLRPDALHSILAKEAVDGDDVLRLANLRDKIPKYSAQNLVLNKLKGKENPYYAVLDVQEQLNKKKPYFVKLEEGRDKKRIVKDLTDAIESYKGSRQNIRAALYELMCK